MKIQNGWLDFNFKNFVVKILNPFRLPLVNELLEKYDNKGFTVTVRQLDLIGNGNYRPQLRRVKQSDDKCVVLACSTDALPEVLKQAQQVGLLTDEHQFIITSLDMHTIDLEPFQHSGTNITAARLVQPEDAFVKEITDTFIEMYEKTKKKREAEKENEDDNGNENEEEDNEDDEYEEDNNEENSDDNDDGDSDDAENENEDDKKEEDEPENDPILEGLSAEKISLDVALTFDAVLLFSEIVKLNGVGPTPIECGNDKDLRLHGISDIMAMKTVDKRRVKGLTGNIYFDQKGHRSEFIAEIIELASDGVQKIGLWNSTDGELYVARANLGIDLMADLPLRNKSFVVLISLVRTYILCLCIHALFMKPFSKTFSNKFVQIFQSYLDCSLRHVKRSLLSNGWK